MLSAGKTLTLNNLTLTDGYNDYDGGAIFNRGTMTLNRCTLSGNRVGTLGTLGGGAIINYVSGNLTLNQCTLTHNSNAPHGGAICNTSDCTLTLIHCTVSGNSSTSAGGGIFNEGSLTLNNSVVADNIAGGTGGDIFNNNSTYTRSGANIVPFTFSGGSIAQSGPAVLTSSALLAPLGNYDGSTQTMALLPGSPARNAALGSTLTSDQRGFPIVGTRDIGAYEAGTRTNYNAYIYETLPATANAAAHAALFDFDGDGSTNQDEFAAGTLAENALSVFRPVATRNAGDLLITFPSVTGKTYTLQQSDTLAPGSWIGITGRTLSGTGSSLSFSLPQPRYPSPLSPDPSGVSQYNGGVGS